MAGEKGSSERELGPDLTPLRELIGSVITDDRWREMIERIAGIAEGDGPYALEAAQLLMSYAFGLPAQVEEEDEEGEEF